MIWIIPLIIGGVLGAILAGSIRRKHPTLQEQLDTIAKTTAPATAEDLIRLMVEGRLVAGAGPSPGEAPRFFLRLSLPGAEIKTTPREHLGLVLKDIPAFVALVEEAQALQS